MKTKIISLFFILCFSPSFAQDVIELRNPSFENPPIEEPGKPFCCIGPRGWFSCGEEELNTPDPQPGNFGVELPATDGDFYISLVARDNDSWEAISQKLRNAQLLKEEEYYFAISLAHSKTLESQSRKTKTLSKYDQPVKFRIFGGNVYCQKLELLGETEVIDHEEWQLYEFTLKPMEDYQYITLEAFYKTPTLAPYNGNLLMDNCSPIIRLGADSLIIKEALDEIEKKVALSKVSRNLAQRQSKNISKEQLFYDGEAEPPRVQDTPVESATKTLEKKIARIEGQMDTIAMGPVVWTPTFSNTSGDKFQISWNAVIEEGSKIYSQANQLFRGSMAVKFEYDSATHFSLSSNKVESDNFEILYDNFYEADLKVFRKQASFQQIIEVADLSKPISGKVKYVLSKEDGTIDTKAFEFVLFAETGKVIFEKN